MRKLVDVIRENETSHRKNYNNIDWYKLYQIFLQEIVFLMISEIYETIIILSFQLTVKLFDFGSDLDESPNIFVDQFKSFDIIFHGFFEVIECGHF